MRGVSSSSSSGDSAESGVCAGRKVRDHFGVTLGSISGLCCLCCFCEVRELLNCNQAREMRFMRTRRSSEDQGKL